MTSEAFSTKSSNRREAPHFLFFFILGAGVTPAAGAGRAAPHSISLQAREAGELLRHRVAVCAPAPAELALRCTEDLARGCGFLAVVNRLVVDRSVGNE